MLIEKVLGRRVAAQYVTSQKIAEISFTNKTFTKVPTRLPTLEFNACAERRKCFY